MHNDPQDSIVTTANILAISPTQRRNKERRQRTDSALIWHTQGREFEPRLLLQVLRFVDRISTVQYVDLRWYCP